MKIILYIACCLFPFFSFEQSVAIAPVKVIVTDAASMGIANDKIMFIGRKSGKTISGITDIRGSFKVGLPSDDTYDIKIVAIGDAMEYSTIEIPALPPGSAFREMEIQIMYEMGSSFTLSDLHFETGKSTIKSSSYKSLNELVDYMNRKKNLRILIAGHTDSDGDDAANLKLSTARAEAVWKYLISKGIKAERMKTKGYGESSPIADNSVPQGRAANRRTEIQILD